jgi:catalase
MERIAGINWPPALAMVCFFFVPCANAQTSQTAPAEGSAAAQHAPTPTGQQITNAMYIAFGDNHSRAVHAKGTLMQGTFTPDPGAGSISKAKLFTSQKTAVLARFSDFTGIPTIPDTTMDANPRGMAVKFNVPDESEVDVVMHSFDGFPTRTSAEFRELLIAVGSSGKSVPKPTPLDAFLASHPTFLTTQKQPPVSYATTAFFGVNSFKFTNSQGQSTYVRYRFVPDIISMPLHLGPRTRTICKPISRRGSTRSLSLLSGTPRLRDGATSSTIHPSRGLQRARWSD